MQPEGRDGEREEGHGSELEAEPEPRPKSDVDVEREAMPAPPPEPVLPVASVARPGTRPEGWGGAMLPRQRPDAVYRNAEEHLRDELWRVWLRVEYEIRRRWESGGLPMVNGEGGLGVWGPGDIGGLFGFAHAELGGEVTRRKDYGARLVHETWLQRSASIERKVERSLAEGVRLPLVDLADRFGLDARQRSALTFALMPEVDPGLITAYRYLTHDPACRSIDGRLLSMLVYDTPASRSRLARDLAADSPLMFYRLLEADESPHRHDSTLYRKLRPAARLVALLADQPIALDPQFASVAAVPPPAPAAHFPEGLVERVAQALRSPDALIALHGQRGTGKRLLAQVAAARLGLSVLFLDAQGLAVLRAAELRGTMQGLLREARLLGAVLAVPDLDDVLGAQGEREEVPDFVRTLAAGVTGPLVLTFARERIPRLDLKPLVRVDMPQPSLGVRTELWLDRVPTLATTEAEELSERYAVTGGIIDLAARAATAQAPLESPPDAAALDLAVQHQLHDRVQRLGRRLETPYAFEDLVADEDLVDALAEVHACVSERRRVREEWGFKGAQGVSVLLSGEPGVGKTMSATVLARSLGLAIYEIDLSQVVSKWIGETEKNLGEVFDAAEPGHIVLLFNEADSLFGKRTVDVRTANDRYANLETNFLLQRLERFNGLAILTTNMSNAIDPAFRRRFAYDIQLNFPSEAQRAELWRRAIPVHAHTNGLDFETLGRQFELSGGFIKVAAERAAFVAAARNEPMEMETIIVTVERMYRERGKLVPIGRL